MKLEIVKDFDNSYYCNIEGIENVGISEYVSLKQLKQELKNKYQIIVKDLKELKKEKFGRKTYFYQEIKV